MKEADLSFLRNQTEQEEKKILSGEDYVRTPGSTNIAERHTKEDQMKQIMDTLRLWSKRAPLARKATRQVPRLVQEKSPPVVKEKANTSAPYNDFVGKLKVSEDEALVREDKTPCVTWSIPRRAYIYQVVSAAVSAGWERLPGYSVERAEAAMRLHILSSVGASTRVWSSP